jgi:hypothetical protein
VESGFPSENATKAKMPFSGKVESGFPSENATNAKMLERFLLLVSVKPLWRSVIRHLCFLPLDAGGSSLRLI